LELWDDERTLCTFYTVRWLDAEENETNRFFDTYDNMPEYTEASMALLNFIIFAIGDDHGAKNELFNRDKNEVKGLPVKGSVRLGTFVYEYPNFPLRLYALIITRNIVILFNGGVKDGLKNQTSSLVMKWREA